MLSREWFQSGGIILEEERREKKGKKGEEEVKERGKEMEEKEQCHNPTHAHTKVLKIFGGDKLVVIIDGRLRALLQLLSETVQKGTPARGGAKGLKERRKEGRGQGWYGNSKMRT